MAITLVPERWGGGKTSSDDTIEGTDDTTEGTAEIWRSEGNWYIRESEGLSFCMNTEKAGRKFLELKALERAARACVAAYAEGDLQPHIEMEMLRLDTALDALDDGG